MMYGTKNEKVFTRTSQDILNSAYDGIDQFLKDLISGKSQGITDLPLQSYSPESAIAIELLRKHGMITFRSSSALSLVDIQSNGILIDRAGGIRNFLQQANDQNYISLQTKNLQKDVLEMQIQEKDLRRELAEAELQRANFENANRLLTKDLADAQFQLTTLQTHEIKRRKIWAVIGAIGGGVLGYLLKKILGA